MQGLLRLYAHLEAGGATVGNRVALLVIVIRAIGAIALLVLTIHLVFQGYYVGAVLALASTPAWMAAGSEMLDRTLERFGA
jgi:hypothetical protein